MKLDFFGDYMVEDAVFGMQVTYVIARLKETKQQHLFAWGYNGFGQLTSPNHALEQRKPLDLTTQFIKEDGEEIAQVTCGAQHTLVLTTKGKLWALGMASQGQLGFKSETPICHEPRLVQTEGDKLVKAVSCGYSHSIAQVR
jgi:E3 ubiquitin-protein ligase HERC4